MDTRKIGYISINEDMVRGRTSMREYQSLKMLKRLTKRKTMLIVDQSDK